MPLLKLEKDDPQKELEFDIKCALEVNPEMRLEKWWEWNIQMLNFIAQQHPEALLRDYGHQNSSQVIKRS